MHKQAVKSAKFSQGKRHEKISAKHAERPVVPGFSLSRTQDDVSLVSIPKMSCHTSEKIHTLDCDRLSKTELRKKYHREANSHRNMLSRRQTNGATVHPDFLVFGNFLRIVGPMPADWATLDRIDNNDPEYAPGKVRWADKQTQNNNKSDTLIFHYSRTNEAYTTSRLAKLQGVSSATIRKRHERGWMLIAAEN